MRGHRDAGEGGRWLLKGGTVLMVAGLLVASVGVAYIAVFYDELRNPVDSYDPTPPTTKDPLEQVPRDPGHWSTPIKKIDMWLSVVAIGGVLMVGGAGLFAAAALLWLSGIVPVPAPKLRLPRIVGVRPRVVLGVVGVVLAVTWVLALVYPLIQHRFGG